MFKRRTKKLQLGGSFQNAQWANSQYVPQFVGSNYDEMQRVASVLDERANKNRETTDKVMISLAQDRLLKNDESIREGLYKSIHGQIQDLVKSDEGFENSTALVSSMAKEYLTNQNRLKALQNYEKAQEFDKLKSQYGAEALNFGDDPTAFSTLDEEGQARDFNLGIERRGNYDKKMQDLLGQVASDGFTTTPTGQKIEFSDAERYLIKTGQVNRLTKEKLNNLVEGLLPSYKQSSEGAQDIKRLTQLEGFTGEPITTKEGNKVRQTTDIDEDIRQRFRSIAAPQAFNKTAVRWDDFGQPTGGGKTPVNTNGVFSPTQPGSVTDNTSLKPIRSATDTNTHTDTTTGRSYQYIDKATGQVIDVAQVPNIARIATSAEAYSQKGIGLPPGLTTQQYSEALAQHGLDVVEVNKEADSQMAQAYDKTLYQLPQGMVSYPAKGDKSSFDIFRDSYNKAVKNHAKITPSGVRIEQQQAEQYDNLINRSAASSPIYLKEGKEAFNLESFAKKVGTSPSNIKFESINVYYDSPKSDLPGGYVEARVKVDDKDVSSHPATVFIPIGDQFAGLSEPIDNLYKNSFYQGSDTYTMERPYIPMVGGQPMRDQGGNLLAFYTVTYPLPEDQQQEGKPGFRTMVYPGVVSQNGSGGQDANFSDRPMAIGQWKQYMIDALAPAFNNVLNSGQTFNTEDYKKQGLEY